MPRKAKPSRWDQVSIPAGESMSERIPLDEFEDLHVKGTVLDDSGARVKGRDKPRFFVDQDEGGAAIHLTEPASQGYRFSYKITAEDEDQPD